MPCGYPPGVNTPRVDGIDINGPEYQKWIKFIEDGGLLKDVPEPYRLDEVCFWAVKKSKDLDTFERDVRPFIPTDVLYIGFIAGNLGHELQRQEDAYYKARGEILCSRPFPLPFSNGGEKRKREEGKESKKKREKKE